MKKLLALLLPLAALAQVPPASYKALKFPPLREIQLPQIEETTLPNGMKVYLLENHELPLVRGTALVRTGNLFDPADKVGLATLTGDLIRSGGTTARSGDQIDEQLENIAASVESSIDETFGRLNFSTLKERSDEVLAVFHDVLTSPGFRQDKLDLAKSQFRSGISRRNDDAGGITEREFASLVYGRKTPYGWNYEYATIDAVQRADVEAFYKRYYFPANTILAVQGDFNTAEMKAKIEKLFAGWTVTQPPVPAFPKVDNTPKPGIYVATKTDVTQTSFMIGQLGGVLSDRDFPALQVMAGILGGGFQSRLFRRVRTQLGDAYDVGASWSAAYDHPGLFRISGSTKSTSTVAALKAIDQEVAKMRTELVSSDELESAKQTVLNGFVFNFDTRSKTLGRLLNYRYYGYPDDFIFRYRKALAAVTAADVLRVARQYLDPAKFVTVATGNPKDFGTPLTALNKPVSDLDLTIPEPQSEPRQSEPQKQSAKLDTGAAQRGKTMLATARAAMGGAALAAVKDATQVNLVQIDPAAGGLRADQTSSWISPDHFRQDNVLPFGKVITYSDGKSGWVATPQGVQPVPPAQLKQVQFETFRIWYSLIESDLNPDRTVTDLGGGKVEIADKEGHSLVLTFDPKTGLPATETYPAGPPNSFVVETYSDWQESKGVKLPRKIVLMQDGRHYGDITVKSVLMNEGLSVEKLSEKPPAK